MVRAVFIVLAILTLDRPADAQSNPPQIDADIFVTLDARHGELQRFAHRPGSAVRYTNSDAYNRAVLDVRRQAARQIEALIVQYEQGMGLPRTDWRLGVLLNDLGAAFDDPSTIRQMTNAMNGAIRTLAPYLGQNRQVDLVFAQAAHRLANRYALSPDQRTKAVDILLPALQSLKEKKSVEALRLLSQRWAGRQEVPGTDRVLALVEGTSDGSGCPIAAESELGKLLAAHKSLPSADFERRLARLVGNLGAAEKRGCQLSLIGTSPSLQGKTTNTRLVADLAETSLRAEARTYSGEWARATQSAIPDALAEIAEFGTLEQLSRMLAFVIPHATSLKGVDRRKTRPADVAVTMAGILAHESNGDFRRAEIMLERVRQLRPSSNPGQGGWGAVQDVIAAAEFHAQYGRRSKATELARLALGGFSAGGMSLVTREKLGRIVLDNAIDDGDWEGAVAMLLARARAAAQAGDVAALNGLIAAIGRMPRALDPLFAEDMTRHANAMLDRFGRDLSDGKNIRNDHVPATEFAFDLALRLEDRALFERARAVSAGTFAYLSGSRVRDAIIAGDGREAWLLGQAGSHARQATRPAWEQSDLVRRETLRLLVARRYGELGRQLAPVNTENYTCSFGFIEVARHVATERAAGRRPNAEVLGGIKEVENLCAGNSASSVHDQTIDQMKEGQFWAALGEPVVARRYLEPSVSSLVFPQGIQGRQEPDPRDPEAAGRLALLADARFRTGDVAGAREMLGTASQLVRTRLDTVGTPADRAREASRFRSIFDTHVEIASGALSGIDRPNAEQLALFTGALDAVQLARATSTAVTTARLSQRLAAADPTLAALLKAGQDAAESAEILGRQLERMPEGPERAPVLAKLREAEEATRRAGEAIRRANPRLAESEQTKLASLNEIRTALDPKEALLVTHSTPKGLHLVLVTKSSARIQAITAPRGEIEETIRRLRASVEIVGGAVDRFAADAATALHQQIIAPLAPALAGIEHLVVVADGPFESLPFALLREGGASPAYLIERYSLAHLPSVRSVVDLKSYKIDLRQDGGFLGVGDPALGPPGDKVQGISLARLVTRSAGDRVTALKQLASLPDTSVQLKAMSQVMRGRSDDLLLGRDASEARLRALDLGRYKVMTFATHAVVAGEIAGIGEPGIVLTPVGDRPDEDGLLGASEIAAMSLNADLVILSACNTAAADARPGAEGLSGLARSFISAGAKSLVVSHWPVVSDATTALMTRFAEELAGGASPSAAMRTAMLARLRAATSDYERHPVFWAPFFVVGVK